MSAAVSSSLDNGITGTVYPAFLLSCIFLPVTKDYHYHRGNSIGSFFWGPSTYTVINTCLYNCPLLSRLTVLPLQKPSRMQCFPVPALYFALRRCEVVERHVCHIFVSVHGADHGVSIRQLSQNRFFHATSLLLRPHGILLHAYKLHLTSRWKKSFSESERIGKNLLKVAK